MNCESFEFIVSAFGRQINLTIDDFSPIKPLYSFGWPLKIQGERKREERRGISHSKIKRVKGVRINVEDMGSGKPVKYI